MKILFQTLEVVGFLNHSNNRPIAVLPGRFYPWSFTRLVSRISIVYIMLTTRTLSPVKSSVYLLRPKLLLWPKVTRVTSTQEGRPPARYLMGELSSLCRRNPACERALATHRTVLEIQIIKSWAGPNRPEVVGAMPALPGSILSCAT